MLSSAGLTSALLVTSESLCSDIYYLILLEVCGGSSIGFTIVEIPINIESLMFSLIRQVLTRRQSITNDIQELMYDLHDCGIGSESVVQRSIGRSIDIHVCCPQCKACPLIIHDSRIWHKCWHVHISMEKRMALCCVFRDGRVKTVLEEGIFHRLILHATSNAHGERVRYRREALENCWQAIATKVYKQKTRIDLNVSDRVILEL